MPEVKLGGVGRKRVKEESEEVGKVGGVSEKESRIVSLKEEVVLTGEKGWRGGDKGE